MASATVKMTSTSTCQLTVNQAGDTTYNAAPQKLTTQTTAQKASQIVTVTTPAPSMAVYRTTFGVAATASSGLAVDLTTSGAGGGSAFQICAAYC
jgi:hypothetical protein